MIASEESPGSVAAGSRALVPAGLVGPGLACSTGLAADQKAVVGAIDQCMYILGWCEVLVPGWKSSRVGGVGSLEDLDCLHLEMVKRHLVDMVDNAGLLAAADTIGSADVAADKAADSPDVVVDAAVDFVAAAAADEDNVALLEGVQPPAESETGQQMSSDVRTMPVASISDYYEIHTSHRR